MSRSFYRVIGHDGCPDRSCAKRIGLRPRSGALDKEAGPAALVLFGTLEPEWVLVVDVTGKVDSLGAWIGMATVAVTGARKIFTDIKEFAMSDALFWEPSPLLVDLAARSADFDSLN